MMTMTISALYVSAGESVHSGQNNLDNMLTCFHTGTLDYYPLYVITNSCCSRMKINVLYTESVRKEVLKNLGSCRRSLILKSDLMSDVLLHHQLTQSDGSEVYQQINDQSSPGPPPCIDAIRNITGVLRCSAVKYIWTALPGLMQAAIMHCIYSYAPVCKKGPSTCYGCSTRVVASAIMYTVVCWSSSLKVTQQTQQNHQRRPAMLWGRNWTLWQWRWRGECYV